MRPPLLSFVFFLAVRHASPTSMDELPSSISDILEDRNLIPINFKMVNFSSQRHGFLILKYIFRHSYYSGVSFNSYIRRSGGVATYLPHFAPSERIVHIEQSESDNSTHSEYAAQLYHFLSEWRVKIRRGDHFHLFQGTVLENLHDFSFMKHSSLHHGYAVYCTRDNSIYVGLALLHREIGNPAMIVDVRPLGHFEANRTVFVESLNVTQILFVDRGDDFDILFDHVCYMETVTCLDNVYDGYYMWFEYDVKKPTMRREFIVCVLQSEEPETPFGSITTTMLTETRAAKAQLGYVIETAEEEFFARFPTRTSALFKVPESGVFLLRCPEGTVFWFANGAEVTRFECEDETIDDIEIVDLRPERHWIREDPIGNWTEEEATSFTQIPATSLPFNQTEGKGTTGIAVAMVCFLAVALVAVAGGVWQWRKGTEQNGEGGNEVEMTDNSQLNSNSEHGWNNVNFVEE